MERVLAFVIQQGQFDKFLPRLRGMNAVHRTAALAEVRSAWFLQQLGFQVLEWEPLANGNRPGDITVRLGDSSQVFVEVKAPTWKGELGREIAAFPAAKPKLLERLEGGKYINAEARAVDPVGDVIDIITKNAVPKLADDRPNLVVVADDLFSSPVGNPFLESKFQLAFAADEKMERVGGVLLLDPQGYEGEVTYRCDVVVNSACLAPCALPPNVISGLQAAA